MSLPTTITNTTPAQTGTSPSDLGTQARQIKIDVQDLLGIPNATAISTAGCAFAADGMTRVVLSDASGTVHNIQNSGVQFNEQGLDIDFRIEGNNTPNLFTLDAGQDAMSFGGANVDGCSIAFNNLRQRTHVTSVGSQTHIPAQTTDFDNPNGSIAVGSAAFFGIPTWTNANATLTMTEAATVVIAGAPVGSTNVTITTAHALWVQAGSVKFAGTLAVAGAVTLTTDLGVASGGTGVSTFGGTNTLLYTTSADTIADITTGNNGVLITSAGGAPSISSTLPVAVQGNITSLGAVTNIAPGANFTLTQNSVAAFTSVESGAIVNTLRLDAGKVLINETANTAMTTGITAKQSTGVVNEIFALKNADVAHGLTSSFFRTTETDTFFGVFPFNANGGAIVQVIGEDNAGMNVVLEIVASGGQAETAKTISGRGLVDIATSEHNGSNAEANITANGNVFSVRARVSGGQKARFIVDEDGDVFAVNAPLQSFDAHNDIGLLDDFEEFRTTCQLKTDYQDMISSGCYERLTAIGVIGKVGNPAKGLTEEEDWNQGTRPMYSIRRLAHLKVGEARQRHQRMEALLDVLESSSPSFRATLRVAMTSRGFGHLAR